MKKYVSLTLLMVGLSGSAFAGQTVPLSTKGDQIMESKYAGASTCQIDSSTGTSGLLCATGAGIILDIIGSSVTSTDTLVIRDSATANTSFAAAGNIIYAIDKNSLSTNHVYPRFKNGLVGQALVAPGGHAGNLLFPSWTIVYTKDVN